MSTRGIRLYANRLLVGILFSLIIGAAEAQSLSSVWLGGTGNWTDGSLWSTNPVFPNSNQQISAAAVPTGSVILDQSIQLEILTLGDVGGGPFPNIDLGSNSLTTNKLNLARGIISGAGTLNVNGPLEWNNAIVTGGATINALNGVFFNGLPSSSWFGRLYGTLNCYGNSSVQTSAPYSEDLDFDSQAAAINIMPEATFNGSRLMIFGSDIFGLSGGTFTNYGTLLVDDSTLNRGMIAIGTNFVNEGQIRVINSSLDVRSTTNEPAMIQNHGSIDLVNGTLNTIRLNGGSLTGSGQVAAIESNALIAPTGSGLNFSQGILTLLPQSVLAYELYGTRKSIFCPQITNASAVTLGGTLQISVDRELQRKLRPFAAFTLVSAQQITGQFENVLSGQRLATIDGRGSFVVINTGTTVVLTNFRKSSGRQGR